MKIQVDHLIKTGDIEEACSIAIDGDCIDADQCVIFAEMLRKVASGTFEPEQDELRRAEYPSEPFTNDPISGPQTLHDWRDRALAAEAEVEIGTLLRRFEPREGEQDRIGKSCTGDWYCYFDGKAIRGDDLRAVLTLAVTP